MEKQGGRDGASGDGATGRQVNEEAVNLKRHLAIMSPRRPVPPSPPRDYTHTKFTSVRKQTPVGPTARCGLPLSFQAVLAMSRCAQGVSSTNSRIKYAPVIV